MHLPRGFGERLLVGGVDAPEVLNQENCRDLASFVVLLSLLLLNFQCETGSENALHRQQRHFACATRDSNVTAGKAKKLMPMKEQIAAINLPM